jgi:hypothetical protein
VQSEVHYAAPLPHDHLRATGRAALWRAGARGIGCSEDRTGAGPRPPTAAPTDPEIGEDAPINLTDVCGNRFVATNA